MAIIPAQKLAAACGTAFGLRRSSDRAGGGIQSRSGFPKNVTFTVVDRKNSDSVKPNIVSTWQMGLARYKSSHRAFAVERESVINSVPVYVINLARSRDRWERLQQSADAFSLDLRRVEAVEGKLLQPDELGNFDDAGFRRCHGKIAMPAEIGCYFSHIRALEVIAAALEPFAVLVEDDVLFTPAFVTFVDKATKISGWDVIKLVNHRTAAFRPFCQVDDEFAIGRCLHGPLGSSAAYIVTREGAAKLLAGIRPMRVPYDVALERGWAGHYEIFTTDKPVVEFSDVAVSTIAQGRSAYAKKRLPPYKRLTTLFFRTADYVRRIVYALAKRNLREATD
ncbi:glycosyltransferase family 25 protein [Brucella sp. 22210]|uniref:glycosyltransferase family 25 protein n=1 Tax=Brucella sp. 22210 TaxID=3453892 RepID=UPI003F84DE76